MAQFQAYRNPRSSGAQIPFLLDVQSDLVNIGTRLVVPLVLESAFGARLTRINPVLLVDGQRVVASVADLASVPLRQLKDKVADCSKHRSEIVAAVDFLLSGF
jgi:toxin CcdB